MIKLKHLLLLKELWMPGSMTSDEDDLIPYNNEFSAINEGDNWFMYEGSNDWNNKKATVSAYITENDKPCKIWVEVNTRWLRKKSDGNAMIAERVRKHIKKVARAWSGIAKKIHKEGILTEMGNRGDIPWKECFIQALNAPQMKKVVEKSGVDDQLWMRAMPKDAPVEQPDQGMVDPVNFTPRA